MKTVLAIILYAIVFGLFAGCVVGIVIWLLTFPPCSQTSATGGVCAVDTWSIVGLASTVLGVSATVLALLGAFSVAAWWTSLNKRVTKRVTKLIDKQQIEIDKKVDALLKVQEQKIVSQITGFQAAMQALETRTTQASAKIDELNHFMANIEEMTIEGLLTSISGSLIADDLLETWGQKAAKIQKTPKIPLKVAESFLDKLGYLFPLGEQTLNELETKLEEYKETLKPENLDKLGGLDKRARLRNIRYSVEAALRDITTAILGEVPRTFASYNGIERWIKVANDSLLTDPVNEEQNKKTIQSYQDILDTYKPKLDLFEQKANQLTKECTDIVEFIAKILPE